MKTLLILALVMTGCGFNGKPTVIRAGVGPDYTPTPTVSKIVIKELGPRQVYVLTGNGQYGNVDIIGVYATHDLAEIAETARGESYLWYSINKMDVVE